MMNKKIKSELRLEGVPASPGIAIGRVHVIGGDIIEVEKRQIKDVDRELKKLFDHFTKTAPITLH